MEGDSVVTKRKYPFWSQIAYRRVGYPGGLLQMLEEFFGRKRGNAERLEPGLLFIARKEEVCLDLSARYPYYRTFEVVPSGGAGCCDIRVACLAQVDSVKTFCSLS